MSRPMTLTQRRRTPAGPEFARLEALAVWLDERRNTDRLDRRIDGPGWVHLHRRTRTQPWAEVATYPTQLDFARSRGIGAPR